MTTTTAATASLSTSQRALILAGLAVGSAVLSNFCGITVESGRLFDYPVLPGLYFGIVLALGAWLWATQSTWRLAAIVIAIIVIWVIAFQSTMSINLVLRDIFKPLSRGLEFWITVGSGAIGGAIGGTLTAAITGWLCKASGLARLWLRTGLIGAAAGTLLMFFDDSKNFAPIALPDNLQLLPLFIVWQPAVAASIGYALPGKPDS